MVLSSAENKGPLVIRTTIAVVLLANLAIALRLWARRHRAARLWLDDWLMLGCLPLVCALLVLTILSVECGGTGQHLDAVMATDPAILDKGLLLLFIDSFAYATTLLLAKTSVVAFYARIFPIPMMRTAFIVLSGLGLSWWIIIIFITAFQCSPIDAAYTASLRWGEDSSVRCFDMDNYFVYNAACNILSDVLILVMPIIQVSQLHISRPQRALIIGIFLIGLLFTIMSCLRLVSFTRLAQAGANADFTYMIADCWLWTNVEICVGIVSACLPNLSPLLSLIVGKRWFQELGEGRKRSSRSSIPTLVTIGGTGEKTKKGEETVSGSRRNRANTAGSAERLCDEPGWTENGDLEGLWPKGYRHERKIQCSGSSDPEDQVISGTMRDEMPMIPMNSIAVRKEVEWISETRDK